MRTSDFVCFGVGDRPEIELCLGDRWLLGELRSWIRRGPAWWAHITYDLGHATATATVPASRIRSSDPRAQAPTQAATPTPARVPAKTLADTFATGPG